MKIEFVNNVRYSRADHSAIDCDVKFDQFETVLPYTATAHDEMDYGKQLWQGLVLGTYGSIGEYVAPLIHKTSDEAIAEGYAYLDSLGWTQDAIMAVQFAANTSELQTKLAENASVVLQMRKAAKANPATFDATRFTIPYTPEEFGL